MTIRNGLLKATALAALLIPLGAVALVLLVQSPGGGLPPGVGMLASRFTQTVAVTPLVVFLLTIPRLHAENDAV